MGLETHRDNENQEGPQTRRMLLQREALKFYQASQGYSDRLRTELQQQRSQTQYLAVYQLACAQSVLESLKKATKS